MERRDLKWRDSLVGFASTLFFVGCAPTVDLTQPPDLRLGEDPCDECKMIISEIRFAGLFYDADTVARRFDDLGCLLHFLKSVPEPPSNIWVHAYEGESWLELNKAFFVRSDKIHTAMGSGFVAMDSLEAASRLAADQDGEVLTFEALAAVWPARPVDETYRDK